MYSIGTFLAWAVIWFMFGWVVRSAIAAQNRTARVLEQETARIARDEASAKADAARAAATRELLDLERVRLAVERDRAMLAPPPPAPVPAAPQPARRQRARRKAEPAPVVPAPPQGPPDPDEL